MELKTNHNKHYGTISFMINLPFGWAWRISTTAYKKPNEFTYGYNNRCRDGKYILFMDYDDLTYEDVSNEVKLLQKRFGLGDAHIFKLDREKSWHVVCLDKLTLYENWEILHNSSCDSAFINAIKTMNTRKWVLRIAKKGVRNPPLYFMTIPSETKREQSNAHKIFLQTWFSILIKNIGKWDKFTTIGVIEYNTANRTN